MIKLAKKIGFLLLLIIFTAVVVRWIVFFLISTFLIPTFVLTHIINIHFDNLSTAITFKFPFPHIDIYPVPFPVVSMNQNFDKFYKNFRLIIVFFADLLSFLVFLRIVSRLPLNLRLRFYNFEPLWINLKKLVKLKKFKYVLGGIIILAILFGYFVGFPSYKIFQASKDSARLAKESLFLLKNQDYPGSETRLKLIKEKLKISQNNFDKLSFIGMVPLINNYYYDGKSLLSAGDDILNAGLAAFKTLPQVKFSSFEQVGDLTPAVDSILDDMSQIKKKTDGIDPGRYPVNIIGVPVRQKIIVAKTLMEQIDNDRKNISNLSKILPEMLGFKSQRNYAILYQDRNEIKATGGTLTSFGIFSLDKGKFSPKGSYEVSNSEINNSPDFYYSMENFRKSYLGGDVNGIIAIDEQFVSTILSFLGPIPVFGRVLTSEKSSSCNCPRVFNDLDELILTDKKEVIGVVLNAILLKARTVPPQNLPDLGLALWQAVKEKHVLFYLANPEEQKIIEEAGMAGRLTNYKGDYLAIIESNLNGVKEDRLIKRSVEDQTSIDSSGNVIKKLTINYLKDLPSVNTSENSVRLYVPLGSKILKDYETGFRSFEEAGKTVFETSVKIKPQVGKKLTIEYTVPVKVGADKQYSIYYQKQPGINEIPFEIWLNGQKRDSFTLRQDGEFLIK